MRDSPQVKWRTLEASGADGDCAFVASVDVEEHFHAAALAPAVPRDLWPSQPSRVVANTQRTLDVFAQSSAKGTFFVLGSVAQRYPSLVREIAEAGHEIASHGHDHHRVGELGPAAYRADIERSKSALEQAAGVAVRGYRAPNFSIDARTWWAYVALAEAGYSYSSSVYPIRHDHYGMPGAPRAPFLTDSGVVEFPVTTFRTLGQHIPAGGGGYFRLAPYWWSEWVIAEARRQLPLVINYFHPWELDPQQPRHNLPSFARFRHYVNLSRMEGKLRRLLGSRSWRRFDQTLGAFRLPPATGESG